MIKHNKKLSNNSQSSMKVNFHLKEPSITLKIKIITKVKRISKVNKIIKIVKKMKKPKKVIWHSSYKIISTIICFNYAQNQVYIYKNIYKSNPLQWKKLQLRRTLTKALR